MTYAANMRRAALFFAWCAVGAIFAGAQEAQTERQDVARFRQRVEAAMASSDAAKGFWGAVVLDEATGETLYALNPANLFRPASNVKLFTTTFALAALGPAFRFRTTLESSGELDADGKLHGDLALVGRGDPTLSNRVFPFLKRVERQGPADKALVELVDQLLARGVKEIEGDIVADDSYFVAARFPSGWTVDDAVWSYGSAVSAIAINDNAMTLTVSPGPSTSAPLHTAWDLGPGRYELLNQTWTALPDAINAQLSLAREPESLVFRLGGSMPLDSPPRLLALAVPEPAEQAAVLLRDLLLSRGMRISGRSRARHAGDPLAHPSNRSQQLLAERFSPPLIEVVRVANKMSQNLYSELLLRVAAKESVGAQTLDESLEVAKQFRTNIGLLPDDVVQSDGAGLSRSNLATPQSVAGLLLHAVRQPWGEEFVSTLPVAGEDGTLENRLKGTPAAGRVRAKTGTIFGAVGLSGYATSMSGQRLVFALFSNNSANGRDANSVFDAICVAMVEELGAAAAPATDARVEPVLANQP
jgi:D-alanyl-D-alanine carboxypeptidase/D-alanyl-D-alanine-endopeptidase (penicillin-binding protein 4)